MNRLDLPPPADHVDTSESKESAFDLNESLDVELEKALAEKHIEE